jgi:hypothetical protein
VCGRRRRNLGREEGMHEESRLRGERARWGILVRRVIWGEFRDSPFVWLRGRFGRRTLLIPCRARIPQIVKNYRDKSCDGTFLQSPIPIMAA